MTEDANAIKALPVLEGEEDYPQWKVDIEIWKQFYPDASKTKQGPAIYFKLPKKTER